MKLKIEPSIGQTISHSSENNWKMYRYFRVNIQTMYVRWAFQSLGSINGYAQYRLLIFLFFWKHRICVQDMYKLYVSFYTPSLLNTKRVLNIIQNKNIKLTYLPLFPSFYVTCALNCSSVAAHENKACTPGPGVSTLESIPAQYHKTFVFFFFAHHSVIWKVVIKK